VHPPWHLRQWTSHAGKYGHVCAFAGQGAFHFLREGDDLFGFEVRGFAAPTAGGAEARGCDRCTPQAQAQNTGDELTHVGQSIFGSGLLQSSVWRNDGNGFLGHRQRGANGVGGCVH